MDEAWVAYLCMILLVLVLILMKQKPDDEIKKETDTGSSSTPTTYYGGSFGRPHECSEEEIVASMERLTNVLFSADTRKREPHHELRSSPVGKEVSNFQPKWSHDKIQVWYGVSKYLQLSTTWDICPAETDMQGIKLGSGGTYTVCICFQQ